MKKTYSEKIYLIATPHETRVAWRLAVALLVALTVAKGLHGIPYIGPFVITAVACAQLFVPLWRCDARGLLGDAVGLHGHAWRQDARLALMLAGLFLPVYAGLHYAYMTQAHTWLQMMGADAWAAYVPQARWAPHWPADAMAWLHGSVWFGQLVATHLFGVALPEETFYRGYLQPCLEARWAPQRQVLGVPLGRGAVVAAALFAAGHFLGEWDPQRLGPFFPALAFAWLRNASGSVWGAIAFHALCNICSACLYAMYV